jgi:hypothetical protein
MRLWSQIRIEFFSQRVVKKRNWRRSNNTPLQRTGGYSDNYKSRPASRSLNCAQNDERLRVIDSAFLAPRRCLLEPIPEIWTAARLLHEAVDAHLSGETHRAEALIREADVPAIAKWTDAIWGHRSQHIHRFRSVPNSPPALAKELRPQPRMPNAETQLRAKKRDGFFCRFCGIPVIENRSEREFTLHIQTRFDGAAKMRSSTRRFSACGSNTITSCQTVVEGKACSTTWLSHVHHAISDAWSGL